MQYSDFKREIKFILICSLCLDGAVFLISSLFIGFTFSMAVSLLIGTAVLILNMRLLYNSVLKNTRIQNTAGNPMLKGYLLRSFISCTAIAAGFKLNFLNPLGIILPLIYPKPIYTVHSIIVRR